MPTYDYECDACGHEMELFQRISEDPVKKCPECRKNKLRRLFGTGAAIVFKGSGFYETDYRSDSYKKDAEKARESKKDSSSDSNSDTKSKATDTNAESKSSDSKPKQESSSRKKKSDS